MAFDQTTRNRLQSFVSKARAILSEEFTRQLQATYGLDPNQGTIADIESLSHLDNYQLQTAHILRDTVQHYMTTTVGKTQKEQVKLVLERIVREQAFTVLNRLAALRMAEARGFLLESIGSGYSSQGFQLYQMLEDGSHGETGNAYQSYLFSLFDEFGLDLAVLFDRFSVQGRLFPRETALLQLLEQINDYEIEPLWAEDETIGWIYQFWNGRDEIDKMRSASRAPRTSREMAVRNQFFTPRYVVEFLTDNTLGRIWYEMTKGNTALVDSCQYLVKRPNEVFLSQGGNSPIQNEAELDENLEALTQEEILKQPVDIPHRPLKDPRTIRMLDPACGSMHFGLYAFDLFEQIYIEAWQIEAEQGVDVFKRESDLASLHSTFKDIESFKQQIPKLIIEHNIHGVDIDPRAVQIAGLSLWQRAQRAWHEQGVKPNQRPTIVKSNIVCAEPMPGEQDLLKEFTSTLNPPALGQLVEVIFEKMALAGEAGTLLKIEQEIQSAIDEARNQWQDKKGSNHTGDLFEDELLAATPQQELGFDLSGIDDETFWEDAEQLILQSLENYSEKATSAIGEKRLFVEDAAKGFAFIDLSRKRFDVVLMNPPFGMPSKLVDKYIKTNYITTGDVISQFFERLPDLLTYNGKSGAITSRTVFYLTSQSKLRENVLFNKLYINGLVDLGDNVLDAMVETALSIMDQRLTSANSAFFIRALVEKNKEKKLIEACKKINSAEPDGSIFYTNQLAFSTLPSTPMCYWVKDKTINSISKFNTLEEDMASVRVGLQTGDDFRFLRLFWEAPIGSLYKGFSSSTDEDINHSRHEQESYKRWAFYTKTDEAEAWYSPINLVVDWLRDGEQLKANVIHKGYSPSKWVQSENMYFKPGFSYMLRSSRLVPYIVPKGCIPTAGRSQVFPKQGHEIEVLSLCASNLGSAIARFSGEKFGWPKFQAGMVQKLPYIKLKNEVVSAVEITMMESIKKAKNYYSTDETTLDYVGCNDVLIKYKPTTSFNTLIGKKNELMVAESYGLNEEEYQDLQLDLQQAVSLRREYERPSDLELEEEAAFRYLSWLVGTAFGRWNSKCLQHVTQTDIYDEMPEQSPAFKWSHADSNIERLGVSDLISPSSLISTIHTLADINILQKCLSIVGVNDLEEYLQKPNLFFAAHFSQYSKNRRYAPIYWPLQTNSGSYTLWVYYHRLNSQTLYSCVNDFVEPKLILVTEDLNALSNKSNRSSIEEKELTKLTDLQSELKDFRDELLRLAKIWKPNLNDGVQITAAPLWKLFQHTAWQKKLKETWENLEEGEYDWAHLAASIWPDRVLRKCHQDRSLAIAHDVEDLFWQEVEVPVMRGKKPTGKTKLEWQPIPACETTLNDMVNEAKARLQ